MSDESHIVEIHSRFAILAPGPAPEERDIFSTWDWDETTTGEVLYTKAIEKFKRTPTEGIEGEKSDGAPWMLYDKVEYFHIGEDYDRRYKGRHVDSLPRYRWLAIYAVEGDSEGHYIHASLVLQEHDHYRESIVFVIKTFYGMTGALEMVNVLTRFFNFNK